MPSEMHFLSRQSRHVFRVFMLTGHRPPLRQTLGPSFNDLLKKFLQPSQVMAPKWTPLAMSPHTTHSSWFSRGSAFSGSSVWKWLRKIQLVHDSHDKAWLGFRLVTGPRHDISVIKARNCSAYVYACITWSEYILHYQTFTEIALL